MKLNIGALSGVFAVVWGGGMLVVGLANLISPGYGQEFLQLMASVYPGYQGTASIGQVIIGTLYATLDAAIVGAIFAWIYNLLIARASTTSSS
jgi:hypothetical protein